MPPSSLLWSGTGFMDFLSLRSFCSSTIMAGRIPEQSEGRGWRPKGVNGLVHTELSFSWGVSCQIVLLASTNRAFYTCISIYYF